MCVFNIDKIHLDDVEFYCDRRLDKVNIYSVVLVTTSVDFDLIITEFCKQMCKYSFIQMIQETASDFCRFTFVSHVPSGEFSKCLNSLVDRLGFCFKCSINVY